jgi:hypothetical protein
MATATTERDWADPRWTQPGAGGVPPDPISTLTADDMAAIGDPSRREAWVQEQMAALLKEPDPARFAGRLGLLAQLGELLGRGAPLVDPPTAEPAERDYGF